MSVIPSEYAACPFPANSSKLLEHVARSQDWWSYRQLRALQDEGFRSSQLFHLAYYKPIVSLSFTLPSPIQVGTEHYFEWRSVETNHIIVSLHIIISPVFCFFEPNYQIVSNSYKSHPSIICLWHDCPHFLSFSAHDYLENVLGKLWPEDKLDLFCKEIDWFISRYYKTVTPWSAPQNLYPNSPSIPHYASQSSGINQ